MIHNTRILTPPKYLQMEIDFDATIVDLMEKNKSEVEEIRSLKIEQESQAMMLCEVTK